MSSLPDFLLEFDLKLFLEYFPEDPSTNPPEVLSGNPAEIPCGNLVGGPSENPFAVFFPESPQRAHSWNLQKFFPRILHELFPEFLQEFLLKILQEFYLGLL